MATAVRSTLPPSSTSGDVIASHWTSSEMLQIRIEIIVLLCDIVLAGTGVALLATGCQSQGGGGFAQWPPPPKYATGWRPLFNAVRVTSSDVHGKYVYQLTEN